MSEYARFTRDVAIIAVTQVVLALRGLALLPIVSKMLGASDYGIWAQVMVTIGLVSPLFQLGLTTALVRFLAAEEDRRGIQEGFYSILTVVALAGLVVAVILFFLAVPISNVLFGGAAAAIIRMTAGIVLLSGLYAVCLSYFIAFRQTRTYGAFMIARSFGEVGLVAGLVLTGFGIEGAVFAILIAAGIASTIALGMIVSRIGVKRPGFTHMKSYLRFGLPLLPSGLLVWVIQSSDRFVIGYFLGIAEVGIYSAIYAAVNVLSYYRMPLVLILRPVLSKLYDDGKIAEVRTYLRYSLKYLLMLTIPSVVGFSLLGREILGALTTKEFLSFDSSVIPLLAVGLAVPGIAGIAGSQVLTLTKKTNIIAIASIAPALLNLALNLVFVPRFGIVAAAATTLFAYVLMAAVILNSSLRQFTFRVDWAFILKSVSASAVMSVVVLWLSPSGTRDVVLVIGLGAMAYGVALFLVGGFNRNEIRFFFGLVSGRTTT